MNEHENPPIPAEIAEIALPQELSELTEQLARHVHRVWAEGRMAEGWIYGPERNDALKQHPGLVSYDELTQSERDYDRRTALGTLRLILSLGYRISKP